MNTPVKIRVYDNGGKTFDRYTCVFLQDKRRVGRYFLYACLAMSEDTFHGLGTHCEAQLGKHLGRRIKFITLPQPCQAFIMQDLKGYGFSEIKEA
jgi:hypothetical protein